jgi:hypothetical protein
MDRESERMLRKRAGEVADELERAGPAAERVIAAAEGLLPTARGYAARGRIESRDRALTSFERGGAGVLPQVDRSAARVFDALAAVAVREREHLDKIERDARLSEQGRAEGRERVRAQYDAERQKALDSWPAAELITAREAALVKRLGGEPPPPPSFETEAGRLEGVRRELRLANLLSVGGDALGLARRLVRNGARAEAGAVLRLLGVAHDVDRLPAPSEGGLASLLGEVERELGDAATEALRVDATLDLAVEVLELRRARWRVARVRGLVERHGAGPNAAATAQMARTTWEAGAAGEVAPIPQPAGGNGAEPAQASA